MKAKRRNGHVINTGRFTPRPPTMRRSEIVQYILDTYGNRWDMPWLGIKVEEAINDGVQITPELIDHIYLRECRKEIRDVPERQPTGRAGADSHRTGFVYFISNGDRIKIGHSVDPGARAIALSLRETGILGVIEGDQTLERTIQRTFTAHRIERTEWFNDCEEIRAYVKKYAERFTKHHRSRRNRPVIPGTVQKGYVELARAIGRGA